MRRQDQVHRGESILGRPVTPAVRLKSKVDTREYLSSKALRKRQSNKRYETNHSVYWSVIICNCKHGHSVRRICKMMTLKEIRYNPATSTFLLVVGLASKSFHTENILFHIESTGGYTCRHNKQV
jgi:hypothetical protein